MSALGQKQTCAAQKRMSALPPIADIRPRKCHVCFVPIADIGKTSGATKRMGPSPVLVLRAAERNQNANYEVQA